MLLMSYGAVHDGKTAAGEAILTKKELCRKRTASHSGGERTAGGAERRERILGQSIRKLECL